MGRTREVLPNWKRWGWSLSGILCLPTKPLDAAAAAAHGWAADASDGDVLRESLARSIGATPLRTPRRSTPAKSALETASRSRSQITLAIRKHQAMRVCR